MYRDRELKLINTILGVVALVALAFSESTSAGPTLAFNYPNGFASSAGAIHLAGGDTGIFGSVISLTDGASGDHEAGAAWYITQQNIASFTTDFTFQPNPNGYGITFCIQNSNKTTNPLAYGYTATADSNVLGYGAYNLANASQYAILNSVAVKFDQTDGGQNNFPSGGAPNATGLYINGGTQGGLVPEIDLNPSGINLHSGNVMAVHIVYDGSVLTLTLRDTVTNAQFRTSWPIDIPAVVGSNSAWVGFTAGTIPAVSQNLLTWSFSQGLNARLATPMFNLATGSYTSAQTVSISGPAGATIYYTTNGQQPTSASRIYNGPISVSSSEIIQAIATQTGYTDSFVSLANYQIAPANTPLINFPNGFSNAAGLIIPVGYAAITGSALQLTDAKTSGMEAAAAWYAAPVNLQSFSTTFQFQTTGSGSLGQGLTFCMQNQPSTSSDPSIFYVSGGPLTVGPNNTGLGYSGATTGAAGLGKNAGILNSVAVKFDLLGNGGNTTGLFMNGADVSASGIPITGLTLSSGHPINVTLSYDGTTLRMAMIDTVTSGKFAYSWAVNIPNTVGGNTGYVGFTGSTGYFFANQSIQSWTYATSPAQSSPIPAAPTNLRVQ